MTERRGLRRRELLSGLATVGALGAASSAGAVGLFSDRELFTGNLLAAGELDLDLCWARGGGTCQPRDGPVSVDFGAVARGDSGSATINCRLQDNPGWLWLRTDCPADACGIERALEVSLWYDGDCDGATDDGERYVTVALDEAERSAVRDRVSADLDLTSPVPIRDLRLCDAQTLLHFGTPLDGNPATSGVDPLAPATECCLGFGWTVTEPVCGDPDHASVTFEFYTEQARHNSDPASPWPEATFCQVDCTGECPTCTERQDISFVAFCIEDGTIEDGDVTLAPRYDGFGNVYAVEWCSDAPLSDVVLYYANGFENFAGPYQSGECGVAEVGQGVQAEPCRQTDQSPSNPCPGADGCGVKYEFDEGRWESVCGTPLNCGGGR